MKPLAPIPYYSFPLLGHGARNCAKALAVMAPLLLFALGLSVVLIIQAPNDYQHGITGKILYIHVPSAWLATLCYIWMFTVALVIICKPVAIARGCLATAAPLGAAFTTLTLVTGSLWGRAAWGSWWVWDARLTSVFVLWLLYLAIIFLGLRNRRTQEPERAAAILTLFGFVIVPIIKFSAQWWHALHQPTSLWRSEGPAIEMTMLIPLITMTATFILLFIVLQLLALRAHFLSQHLQLLLSHKPVMQASHEAISSLSTPLGKKANHRRQKTLKLPSAAP